MTKRIDPEIKAMRAINRAITELGEARDEKHERRALEWMLAARLNMPWFPLPVFPARVASPGTEAEEGTA